jgi:hypothetical protein
MAREHAGKKGQTILLGLIPLENIRVTGDVGRDNRGESTFQVHPPWARAIKQFYHCANCKWKRTQED